MTPARAIAESIAWLPGSVSDKAAKLGVHKSTLFAWLSEAEGRSPAPREGRAGRKRHREPTWVDVLKLARLMREHGKDVVAVAVTAERLAAKEMDAARSCPKTRTPRPAKVEAFVVGIRPNRIAP